MSERYGWSAREKMKLRRRVALLALTGVVARGTFAFVVTPWWARNTRTRHGFLPVLSFPCRAPGLSSVPLQILSDDMVPTTIEKFMQGEAPGLSKATLGEYLERGWLRIKGGNGAESQIRFRDELVFPGDTVAVLLPKLGSDVALGGDSDMVLDAAALEWVSIPASPRSSGPAAPFKPIVFAINKGVGLTTDLSIRANPKGNKKQDAFLLRAPRRGGQALQFH
jgi:hypothetical protein